MKLFFQRAGIALAFLALVATAVVLADCVCPPEARANPNQNLSETCATAAIVAVNYATEGTCKNGVDCLAAEVECKAKVTAVALGSSSECYFYVEFLERDENGNVIAEGNTMLRKTGSFVEVLENIVIPCGHKYEFALLSEKNDGSGEFLIVATAEIECKDCGG